jgi:predicted transcriptional regulator
MPFVKGQKANPKGYIDPKWSMSGLIREALEEMDRTGVPKKKIIARKLVEKAVAGEDMAIKEINNRLDGMPKQSQDITSGGQVLTGLIVIE